MAKFNNKLGRSIGIIFALIGLFVLVNQGNLPDIFTKQIGPDTFDTTVLGKILLAITFPFAILGLSIEGLIPEPLFIIIVLIVQFLYGYLIGLGIDKISKRKL